jgi:hypothetical protein
LEIEEIPDSFEINFDSLTKVIEKTYKDSLPDQRLIDNIKKTQDDIEMCLQYSNEFQKKYRDSFFIKYGSSINGLLTRRSSDLDLTLIVQDFDLMHEDILREMKAVFRESRDLFIVE